MKILEVTYQGKYGEAKTVEPTETRSVSVDYDCQVVTIWQRGSGKVEHIPLSRVYKITEERK